MHLETPRLILRRFCEADRAPFASLNADPRVMRFFAAPLSRAESDGLIARIEAHWQKDGFGFAAVERREDGAFIGMVGIQRLDEAAFPFAPAVEVGWRLAFDFWGKGYASEAAEAAMAYGFDGLKLHEIVAYTAEANLPSQAVMARIGMTRDPNGDFDHPRLPEGHPLRRHVVYRKRAPDG